MEFIQCPHCQKQYAVSDKLRAAAGKKIRCKHCKQAFEIKVQSRSESKTAEPETTTSEQKSAEPASTEPKQAKSEDDGLFDLSKYNSESYFDSSEQTLKQENEKNAAIPDTVEQTASEEIAMDAPEDNPETDKETKKAVVKTKPAKKTFNIQLLITIVLATVLLISAVAAYLFLTQPELFSAAPKKAERSIVTEELFKPIEIKIADPKPEPVTKKEPVRIAAVKLAEPLPKTAVKTPIKPKAKQKPAKIFKPSQVCKNVSAEYWVRSNRLATSSLDTNTYMKLLDQNLVQADEIRHACKDKTLIGIISKAARTENRLSWIKREINIVLDKAEANKKRQN